MSDTLTPQEHNVFEVITTAANLCLVRGFYEGKPVGVVALIDEQEDGINIHPIAMLLDDEMKEKLEPTDDYEKREV